jgi:hypothetical protein
MNISKQVVILSAERLGLSVEENQERTDKLEATLNDINLPFSRTVGVYNNGPEEKAFVVVVNNEADIETLKGFAFTNFNQDSILHQDVNQEASLFYNDGTIERLGRLVQVSHDVAVSKGNYTILNGEYYTTISRV